MQTRDIICPSLKNPLDITEGQYVGPNVFFGSVNKGHLFSGSWGAMEIILRNLGDNLIVWGDLRIPVESKK